jgi:hypothetical protein
VRTARRRLHGEGSHAGGAAGLDALSAQCDDASLPSILAVMRRTLRGNEEDYYDPRNSFLDDVLERGARPADHA